MELICRLVKGIPIVTLKGNLVCAELVSVRQYLNNIIGQHPPFLILDLAHLSSIDAHGLSVFVSALKTIQQHQGEVLLLNPTQTVRFLVEITHLQEIFSIYADESAAIAHCTQSLGTNMK